MDIGEQVIVISSIGPEFDQIGTITGFIRDGQIVFVDIDGLEVAVPSCRIKKAHRGRGLKSGKSLL